MKLYDIELEKRNGELLELKSLKGKAVARISPIESPMVLESKIIELLGK